MVSIQTIGKVKKVDFTNYNDYKKLIERYIAIDYDFLDKIIRNIFSICKNDNEIKYEIHNLIETFQDNDLDLVIFCRENKRREITDKRMDLASKINSLDSDTIN